MPRMATPPPRLALQRALDDLTTAYRQAMAEIEAAPDQQQALEAVVSLFNVLHRYAGEAAALRAEIAMRIREAEALSLAKLAERLGVSKARADQLVRAAKKG